ncbi:MAG: NTE family protein [Bacteroidia bacterium]|jgi:NTE family protein|tara:strand:+ start:2302 stop:3165 length:864 start_codon:yes stop_codon:yes gene_type:complete
MTRIIENLVFKGGGVQGIAYAGAIEALEKECILSGVKRTAGTSAGAVAAVLISLGYSSNEIVNVLGNTNFKKFQDDLNPLKLTKKYGLYRGEKLLKWVQEIIHQKTGNKNLTFADLENQGYKTLKVFASDLNTTSLAEFSYDKTPNVKIAESIRASMSIPLFFDAWKFPDEQPNNHIYVDGGVLYNYPITAFGDLDKTLGFFIDINEADEGLDFNDVSSYLKHLFRTVLNAQDVDFFKTLESDKTTVIIKNKGISITNFNLTKEQKDILYLEGKNATLNYFKSLKQV